MHILLQHIFDKEVLHNVVYWFKLRVTWIWFKARLPTMFWVIALLIPGLREYYHKIVWAGVFYEACGSCNFRPSQTSCLLTTVEKDMHGARISLTVIGYVDKAMVKHPWVIILKWFLIEHMKLPIIQKVFIRRFDFVVSLSGHVLQQKLKIAACQIITAVYHSHVCTRFWHIELVRR